MIESDSGHAEGRAWRKRRRIEWSSISDNRQCVPVPIYLCNTHGNNPVATGRFPNLHQRCPQACCYEALSYSQLKYARKQLVMSTCYFLLFFSYNINFIRCHLTPARDTDRKWSALLFLHS